MIGKIVYKSSFESLASLPIPEALSILHTANKFMFDSLRTRILSSLDLASLDPWQQYAVAVDHGLDDWLLTSFIGICSLIEAPSMKNVQEFARRNEWDDYIKISAIREDYRARLFLYAFTANQIHPYSTTTGSELSIFSGCETGGATCRNRIKVVLVSLFRDGPGHPYLATVGEHPAKTIHELVLQATRQKAEPSSNRICNTCCGKEGKLMADALGHEQLKAELKKLLQL